MSFPLVPKSVTLNGVMALFCVISANSGSFRAHCVKVQVRYFRYGPKIGGRGACAPLGEGELGPYLIQCGQAEAYLHGKFHLDPSNRLATVHERYRQTGQRTDRL